MLNRLSPTVLERVLIAKRPRLGQPLPRLSATTLASNWPSSRPHGGCGGATPTRRAIVARRRASCGVAVLNACCYC